MNRLKFLLFAVPAIAIAASRPAHAGIVVGLCTPGTSYPTIQAAVNAAPSGAVISVCPGGYPEQIVISKPLTLQGIINNGTETAMILPPAAGFAINDTFYANDAQILVINTKGVTLNNLLVDGLSTFNCVGNLVGIEFHDASGTVNRVALQNQAPPAGQVCGAEGLMAFTLETTSQTVTVENSVFRNQSTQAIYADGIGMTLNTIGNYIVGPENSAGPTYGIGYVGSATGTIQGNTIVNEVYPGSTMAIDGYLSQGIYLGCAVANVSNNVVTHTQRGINVGCNLSGFTGKSTVTGNFIFDTLKTDAIYIGSSLNTVTNNTIVAAGQSGIHFESSPYSTAGGNLITGNSITQTCAGILSSANSKNTIPTSSNYYAVDVLSLVGSQCGPLF